jgi:hypothetical protein
MEPKNITPEQRELLHKLQINKENFNYEWDEIRGVLSFVRADVLSRSTPASSANESGNISAMNGFLRTYATLFGAGNLTDGLELIMEKVDQIGWRHYQFQSFYTTGKGKEKSRTEFYGSKVAAHFRPEGSLVEVQSSCYRDIGVSNNVKVTVPDLQERLMSAISKLKGFQKLEESSKKHKEKWFPLMQKPRLVIYPWKGEMLNTWATYGYAPYVFDENIAADDTQKKPVIAFGQMFFNAETGEMFLFSPTRKGAETATTGSGLGCTPLGGPFVSRSLDIVRVDATSTYLLKNKTKDRDIITYDANADSSIVYPDIPQKISDGAVTVSTDNDGDHNWSRVAADTTDTERTASQQPEVDEHFRVAELYDWYDAIGGRVGWDNDDFQHPWCPIRPSMW